MCKSHIRSQPSGILQLRFCISRWQRKTPRNNSGLPSGSTHVWSPLVSLSSRFCSCFKGESGCPGLVTRASELPELHRGEVVPSRTGPHFLRPSRTRNSIGRQVHDPIENGSLRSVRPYNNILQTTSSIAASTQYLTCCMLRWFLL